jgi:CheY-like chemotaxis protein
MIAPETPEQDPDSQAAKTAQGQALAQNKGLILVAEDNETNRDVMQEQLSLLGYAAEMAEDGAIALRMWRSGRYALLLTDCHMPHLDGFELTQAIRQEEATGSRMPIVAITGDAMPGHVAALPGLLRPGCRLHAGFCRGRCSHRQLSGTDGSTALAC